MSIKINDIEVRSVREEDLLLNKDSIIELLNQNYILNFPQLVDARKYSYENFDKMVKYIKENTAIIIGAFCDENLLGFLWAHERLFLSDKRYHIGHIVINQAFRNKGIGKKLMYRLELMATENNISIIELMASPQNKKTMLFYENIGFDVERVQLFKKVGINNDN